MLELGCKIAEASSLFKNCSKVTKIKLNDGPKCIILVLGFPALAMASWHRLVIVRLVLYTRLQMPFCFVGGEPSPRAKGPRLCPLSAACRSYVASDSIRRQNMRNANQSIFNWVVFCDVKPGGWQCRGCCESVLPGVAVWGRLKALCLRRIVSQKVAFQIYRTPRHLWTSMFTCCSASSRWRSIIDLRGREALKKILIVKQ